MSNLLVNNINTEKLLLGENTTTTGIYTNGTGSSVTLAAGTVMGRISASGKLTPFTTAATDGSQFVVGILVEGATVADAASATLTICDSGEVNQNLVSLQGSDTLETVLSGRRVKDKIGAETVGVKLISSTELSGYDNQ